MPPLLDADLAEARLSPLIFQSIEQSPDPRQSELYISRFRQRHPAEFARLAANPVCLHQLTAIFSYSRFLSEELLKAPGWLDGLSPLDRAMSTREFAEQLEGQMPVADPRVLARFRRQQLLRILIRDAQGPAELAEVTGELSNLADAILDVSYRRIGVPEAAGMAVIALGKLGGRELNYSSDIDLMFVYGGASGGSSNGASREEFRRIAGRYTELLSAYTESGVCYRVDLRLRPEGSLGEVCLSLDAAKAYYQGRARDWELQMLIKARVAAGDRTVGQELLESVEGRIYSTTTDFGAVESVSQTRQRISEKLDQRRAGRGIDVKLAPGGIRDIEFLVQCLQRLHGGREPWVRQGGTLLALSRLRAKDLLSEAEYGRLSAAYRFLRSLEHRLQMEDDRQTHTLPADSPSLDLLARKMGATQLGSAPSGLRLLEDTRGHLGFVREIYGRVVHPGSAPVGTVAGSAAGGGRLLESRAPKIAEEAARAGLRSKAGLEHFVEKAGAWLPALESSAEGLRCLVETFRYSPYFAEELICSPSLAEELFRLGEPEGFAAGIDFRREFRRKMTRLQLASLCLATPVFQTLERASDLADWAIGAAYESAVEQLGGRDDRRLMVLALGRLGMREFDLASDADLLFVLPDRDQGELEFWTRVARRTVDSLSSYTGAGVLFSVDTRLRPNGGAGPLVQTESAYKEYFRHQAEAWEGIAYMKSRAVAGDLERGTQFLNELQDLDWRRYGQSGRSKGELKQMRMRLERERGEDHPLKAGLGGFYDIDFALLYLRLKGAGIFFKVLNMPQRIDVIEKMGHLERADAEFLRGAVTFYRAVDHGLRLYSGHAEGRLPRSEGQMEILSEMVRRWTPDDRDGLPLASRLVEIQTGTRAIFERLFS